ncbi:FmdE family protein [Collinsella sp. An2]|uniref:FmdE family protein n=1 Tax=Collinsella sp. An2 TaxID=1965585 RepID=UPI000B3AF9C0|nr:FmdE family protein [Collinsella sp. An2]OUP10425.1 hypothetical protein B5F33_02280 [Collinsella sp. An2]
MLKRTFEEDLDRAVAFHGHLCAGQVIGTRMARVAMDYFHIEDPDTYRDLVAFVECDRCLADAVISVANCHLGRRRLKWYDYGIMAASFLDLASNKAIRITQRPDVPKAPHGKDEMLAFFAGISDNDLFCVNEVDLPDFREFDLPGRPRATQVCEVCGERVHDGRGVERDGHTYCKRCAGEHVYYTLGRELSASELAQGA